MHFREGQRKLLTGSRLPKSKADVSRMSKRLPEKDITAARREVERIIEEFGQLVRGEAPHDSENMSLNGIREEVGSIEKV